jgi:hypothetical protein
MLICDAESLLAQRNLLEALDAFDRAQRCGEDSARCCGGRWKANMLLGNFENAWQESDSIRYRRLPDPHRFWQGEDLTGKRVILRCLHGLGDAVQFLRYIPFLAARVSHLFLQVPPSLLELAPHFIGVTDLVTWSSPETREPAWDMHVEINELPYIFRTQLDDLPIATKYLKLPASILSANHPKPTRLSNLRVGIVWSSGEWNPSRNVPFSLFRSLLEEPHCEFWNLQGGAPRADCTHPSVHRSEQCVNSLLNLAALIAQLDLIITPDTLVAHLAGATGTPAFLLLQHAADWRWLHDRSDSPWYPTLRLFRQPRPNDWISVIHAVHTALANYPLQALIA